MIRVRAGICYALAEAMDEGHCGLPVDELRRWPPSCWSSRPSWSTAALELELEPRGGRGRHGRASAPACSWPACTGPSRPSPSGCGVLPTGRRPGRRSTPDKAIPWVERKTGLTLAASQREAVRLALRSKVLVITGGPGVGKTTLVNSILKILRAKDKAHGPGGADRPGGQAAAREHRAGGEDHPPPAGVRPGPGGFKRGEEHPLDCDLLVVDETSMVDVLLMRALLRAVPPRAALLLVGDVDQLPSVGPGPGAGRHHRLAARSRWSG